MTAHLTEAEAADLARRVGESMYAADEASKDTMGMELLACQPGRASMRMVVRPLHLNGHKICHGGFIFTLADSTFAFACNSRNHNTVANGCSIEFLRPAHEGDVLTAEGVEQNLAGRNGIYDIRVNNQKGQAVALFRGKSTQIAGTVIPADEEHKETP
ncbi:MAG TPA: hydroxyphenylacetyl-CoA thioesterase PaaI [Ottowia beijingensis]|nr:hydroxyphenylacetyl-CoA thioesterase PaaI [Ottowia beijingensis]